MITVLKGSVKTLHTFMRNIIIISFILILLTTGSLADELQVPTSCYPKKVQAKFEEYGLRLDLSPNDREEDSWGFLVSKGSNFSIFTYRSMSKSDFERITKILGEL